MSKLQFIKADLAAHNIAASFSNKFIQESDNSIISLDDTEICNASKKAAQIYQIVYDEVYRYISDSNSELINDSE